jgi:hypothetical protein
MPQKVDEMPECSGITGLKSHTPTATPQIPFGMS